MGLGRTPPRSSEAKGGSPTRGTAEKDTPNSPSVIEKRTSGETRGGIDPFKKSERTTRSPAQREAAPGQARTHSSPPIFGELHQGPRDANVFDSLGAKIRELLEMMGGGRRSIHQPMRDLVQEIASLYNKSVLDRGKNRSMSDTTTQTPSLFNQKEGTAKRTRKEPGSGNPAKKQKGDQPEIGERKGNQSTPIVNKEGENRPADTWAKVVSRGQRKERKPKARPDAIIIAGNGKATFADILRKVKADPNLGEVGQSVTKIRRTQKGDLLLQLNSSGDKANEIREIISKTLGDQAAVKSLQDTTIFEIKDIDEVTMVEDVRDALIRCQGDTPEGQCEVMSLRRAYANTQTATVRAPVKLAKKFIDGGKIRIGWVVCRIRARKALIKCYKCLEFGHISRQCKSKIDRSKLCRRCGEDGHVARDCGKEPLCMFCRTNPAVDAKHIAGSGRCPIFKKALTNRKE